MRVTLTPERPEQAGQVHGGGIALDVGVGAEDHLGDPLGVEAGQQLADPQLLGADALDRADGALQHVVAAPVLAGLLDGDDVAGLLDHAEDGRVPPGVAADLALDVLVGPSCLSAMLKQRRHHDTRSLTTVMAWASRRASSDGSLSRWKAMRWADLGPTPGRRPSSSIRSWTGAAYISRSAAAEQPLEAAAEARGRRGPAG